MLLTGGVFSAMFAMASVWGTLAGLSVAQIALFVGVMYAGGLVLQYPIGAASDRMDRRFLVMGLSVAGAVVMALAAVLPLPFAAVLVVAFLLGGITNPLYALLIAYTNDFLNREDMPAASAGLIFLNGFGAIFGPLATGWIMGQVGPAGFFLFIGVLFATLAAYAGWRMTRRAAPAKSQGTAVMTPTASALAVEAVLEKSASDPKAA
jgi:MFS family permease